MSRTSLIRPRRPRAVCRRPANGTRLLPSPPHLNTHYKRCPKALRLRLRSDQSTSLPVYVTGYGRSPDKNWLALSRGHCQVRAPLTRRIPFAASGDAPEHGVIVLPWAIAPFSDSAVAALAGESEQSDERRLKTNAPFKDSAVAALAGQSEQSEERRLKTNAPFTDSTVVTIGQLRSTNAGHGSTLPSLRVVEHFRWFRLPHTEISSRLLHVLSEARGCRRAVADVEHPPRRIEHPLWRTICIRTGVDAFLRNRPGPSIPSHMPPPPSPSSPAHAAESPPQVGAASKDRAHRSAHKTPPPAKGTAY